MKYPIPLRTKALLALIFTGRIPGMLKLLLGMFLICPILCAQQTNTPPEMNQQTAQMLLQRMDQLEATVRELRAALALQSPGQPPRRPVRSASPNLSPKLNVPPRKEWTSTRRSCA